MFPCKNQDYRSVEHYALLIFCDESWQESEWRLTVMSYPGFRSPSNDLLQRAWFADSLQLWCVCQATLLLGCSQPRTDHRRASGQTTPAQCVSLLTVKFLRAPTQPGWVFLRIALLCEALPAQSPFLHASLFKGSILYHGLKVFVPCFSLLPLPLSLIRIYPKYISCMS